MPLPEVNKCKFDDCGITQEPYVDRSSSQFWACKPPDKCEIHFGGIAVIKIPAGVCPDMINMTGDGPPVTQQNQCVFWNVFQGRGCVLWEGLGLYGNTACTIVHEDFHVEQWRSYIAAETSGFQAALEAMCMPVCLPTHCADALAQQEQAIYDAMDNALEHARFHYKLDPRIELEAEAAAHACHQAIADTIIATFGGLCPSR